MTMKATITKAVDKAFSSAGDLAVSAILSNKSVTDYSFSTGKVVSSVVSVPTKVIITSTSSTSRGGAKVIGIIKSGETIDIYDTLTVGKISYNIESSVDNGYTIDLNLVKESI